MKNLFSLALLTILLFSCKKGKSEAETKVELIRGEFILIDNAAVIKGPDFIYGVEINDLTAKLAKQAKALQREEYDMVPVVIQGIVKPNPNEGWEEVVEIKEIIGVSQPTSELPTKIKSSEAVEVKAEESGHEGHNH